MDNKGLNNTLGEFLLLLDVSSWLESDLNLSEDVLILVKLFAIALTS